MALISEYDRVKPVPAQRRRNRHVAQFAYEVD